MTTKDNVGLLSKVARFVRNPTKDWSELDVPEPGRTSEYSKQALKEMIERKRQNDFVRRREFDQLRKLRRSGSVITADLAGRPSFFQSSMDSNPDERATTLRKIDEIEAQMSRQWWKGRQGGAGVQGDKVVAADNSSQAGAEHAPGAGVSVFASTQALGWGPDSDRLQAAEYEATQMGLPAADDLAVAGVARSLAGFGSTERESPDAEQGEFSTSKLFSAELKAALTDPDLEEAAIRFANGDVAGAENGLLTALQADNARADAVDGWTAALFDLYRATGQRARFDRFAMDCARRFGRPVPAWFSMPDLLGQPALVLPVDRLVVPAPDGGLVWVCPAALDFQAVQALHARLSAAGLPWHLDWSRLHTITPDAAQALADLFAKWCVQAVSLHFCGAEVLDKTLRSFTPAGDRQVALVWWQLRLDALRILRLQDEFELAALDYCVTYEASPPPWVDARCDCIAEWASVAAPSADARGVFGDAVFGPPANVGQVFSESMSLDATPAAVVELSGEVLGDAAGALDLLQAGLHGADRLVISCARLIRVDFSAAGSILNWVAVRELEGCRVQFHDVPRLVAVFFNVIGINEHARIVPRTR